MGPAFTSEQSRMALSRRMDERNISVEDKTQFMRDISKMALVPMNVIHIYAAMLHFIATGRRVTRVMPLETDNTYVQAQTGADAVTYDHSFVAWQNEQVLFGDVRDGNMDYMGDMQRIMRNGQGITMHGKDDLRWGKGTLICFITNCAAAAIEGGLSVSTAYALS